MALITAVGRSNKIVYGQQPTFTFTCRLFPFQEVGALGLQYINGQANSVGYSNLDQTAGTIIFTPPTGMGSAVTTTLQNQDFQGMQGDFNGAGVANRILLNQALFQAQGWTVSLNSSAPGIVTLTYTGAYANMGFTGTAVTPTYNSYGQGWLVGGTTQATLPMYVAPAVSRPVMALGTATYMAFNDVIWNPGTAQAPIGSTTLDDIYVQGKTPVTVLLTGTGATLGGSMGTKDEQAAGQLTYTSIAVTVGTPLQLTQNWNFLRAVSPAAGQVPISLYITR